MNKKRRAGATETFSVSVDRTTKQKLKTLAKERHAGAGNVSALITELAAQGERQAAFERAWAWYGGKEPTAAESAAVLAEWEEGWRLARKSARPRRRKAA